MLSSSTEKFLRKRVWLLICVLRLQKIFLRPRCTWGLIICCRGRRPRRPVFDVCKYACALLFLAFFVYRKISAEKGLVNNGTSRAPSPTRAKRFFITFPDARGHRGYVYSYSSSAAGASSASSFLRSRRRARMERLTFCFSSSIAVIFTFTTSPTLSSSSGFSTL